VLLVFSLAVLGGVYLAFVAGWPVIVIGLSSLLAGYLYTGGPSPFAYNGLGDIFVWIFFGFVALCGTVFVVSGSVPALAWWAAVRIGALAPNILVVNNIRDHITDRKAGRKNIPVIFGRKGGEIEFLILLMIAYLVPIIMVVLHLISAWVFLVFLSIPSAVRLYKFIASSEISPSFNQALAGASWLELFYSFLFSTALIMQSIFSTASLTPNAWPLFQTFF
jgi:1,4-dihydroxy-2-naphthoate octaprenyltransferase